MIEARVFIAEDRIDVGKTLVSILESANHSCRWMTDFKQIMQFLAELPDYDTPPEDPDFHFWILDANLGHAPVEGQQGRDMASEIHRKNLGGHLINYSDQSTTDVHGPDWELFHPEGDIELKDPFQVLDLIAGTAD